MVLQGGCLALTSPGGCGTLRIHRRIIRVLAWCRDHQRSTVKCGQEAAEAERVALAEYRNFDGISVTLSRPLNTVGSLVGTVS